MWGKEEVHWFWGHYVKGQGHFNKIKKLYIILCTCTLYWPKLCQNILCRKSKNLNYFWVCGSY